MTKGIKYGLIGVLAFLGIAFLILTLTIDSIVKSSIEDIGSDMAGTRATVENVSISPFSGEGTITGFRVANPEGYQTEDALVVDEFYIKLEVLTLWSDVMIVNEIRMQNPTLYVEQKLPDNNLRTLLNNLNEASESETTYGELVIEHFLLQDGSVDLYTEIGGERSARVEMSTIEIHDLGRGRERQAAEQVVREIAGRVVEQALQAAARSGAEQLKDAIKDLFN
ncbi:MAG: hypothetical protein WD035_05890 [Balneolaceae bacterium]